MAKLLVSRQFYDECVKAGLLGDAVKIDSIIEWPSRGILEIEISGPDVPNTTHVRAICTSVGGKTTTTFRATGRGARL